MTRTYAPERVAANLAEGDRIARSLNLSAMILDHGKLAVAIATALCEAELRGADAPADDGDRCEEHSNAARQCILPAHHNEDGSPHDDGQGRWYVVDPAPHDYSRDYSETRPTY